jgi:alkaline phosphatase D
MLRSLYIFLLLSLVTSGLYAGKPHLYAGPMQGHTTDSTLTIWLMSGQKQKLSYTLSQRGEEIVTYTSSDILEKENCWRRLCPVTLFFTGLEPGTAYQLSVHSKTDTVYFQRSFYTIQTFPDELPDFSVMTGSCFMLGTGGLTNMVNNKPAKPIYTAMAMQETDAMLWLGDNLYYMFEFISDRGMRRKNAETRLLPEIQGLISKGIHYSIWDDHEFGPNNSDGHFKRKEASTRIFNAYWPNPPEMLTTSQHYYTFRLHDAEFFMLDGRYHSDRTKVTPHSILGEEQLAWLKEKLQASDATFKILALGNQWYNDKRQGSKELFSGSVEHEPFMSFLDSMAIEGMVLLSGDVHYALLQKIEREHSYPLYELTSSAVSSFPNNGPEKWPGSLSSYTVPGTLYTGNNYTVLNFAGSPGNRKITIQNFDVNGTEMWRHIISEKELKLR